MPQNIPRGTHIVLTQDVAIDSMVGTTLPCNTVGVVDQDGSYIGGTVHAVFPDGRKALIFAHEYEIRRTLKLAPQDDNVDYTKYLVYSCVIGSRAYGLHKHDSDADVRGVYLPPADLHWSLFGVPESLEFKEPDQVYWDFGRFMHLAMKANPSIIECLWTPIITVQHDSFTELLDNKRAFLSKLAYQTYSGYAISQFKKIEDSMRLGKGINFKQAMHMIRLLLNGAEIMRSGEVTLSVEEYRDDLLAIRHGDWSWPQITDWKDRLVADFEVALGETKLPERPDYAILNRILLNARRRMVNNTHDPLTFYHKATQRQDVRNIMQKLADGE